MMALDPQMRFQTPAQLCDAIRQVQLELGGGPSVDGFSSEVQRTVFVVEKNVKFQDVFREKFKALGFRVLMSVDASRALMRYQQQAFDVFVIDLATTGEEGLNVFRQVQAAAAKQGSKCPAVVLMSAENEHFRQQITENDQTAILTFPIKKGALEKTMEPPVAQDLMGAKLLPTRLFGSAAPRSAVRDYSFLAACGIGRPRRFKSIFMSSQTMRLASIDSLRNKYDG